MRSDLTPAHNPGSPEAIAAGCTCPVIDNHHGKGVPTSTGERLFWYDAACPMHGTPTWPLTAKEPRHAE